MWPDKIQCAVCLSFDFDAESAQRQQTLTPISRGRYGPKVGIFRILELLKKYSVPATFFTPGYTAYLYPDLIKEIYANGHELANHGYYHENPTTLAGDRKKERDILLRSNDLLEKLCGERPLGYRAPGWDLNPYSPDLLLEEGFLYDSSLMDQEIPYTLLGDSNKQLLELPVDWILDDYVHFGISNSPHCRLSSPSEVFEIWLNEFKGYFLDRGCFTLTMHPQIIGRSHRMQMLESLLKYMNVSSGVWFATCRDVAEYWKTNVKPGKLRLN